MDGFLRSKTLDLSKSYQPFIDLDFTDPVFGTLVQRLTIDVVRPPPMALGNIDHIKLDALDFHRMAPLLRSI